MSWSITCAQVLAFDINQIIDHYELTNNNAKSLVVSSAYIMYSRTYLRRGEYVDLMLMFDHGALREFVS